MQSAITGYISKANTTRLVRSLVLSVVKSVATLFTRRSHTASAFAVI